MGYLTDFTLTMKIPPVNPADHPAVKALHAFMMRAGFDVTEETACRFVAENQMLFFPVERAETAIRRRLEELADYKFYCEGKTKLRLNEAKWYGRKEDMLKLSNEFPTIEFTLDGEGEDQGDVWKETYIGGVLQKKQKAKLVYEDN